MDLHNKSTSNSANHHNDAPALRNLTDFYRIVVEFNHSFSAPFLQKKVDDNFPPEHIHETSPLEKELLIAELIAEKNLEFDGLLAQHSPFLNSLGLSLSLRATSISTPDFDHAEALFQLEHGGAFINFLSTLAGQYLSDKDHVTILSIIEDLLSYLQFQSDLTNPDDAPAIEFAGAIGGILESLTQNLSLLHDPIISDLRRYHSLMGQKCLHEVVILERAGIFELGSVRVNESGTEFIHIPYSNPSLRWHIICNNVESYKNVWETSISAIEKLLPLPAVQDLTSLAITTTLENLTWIKQDLNSNGWNLRDDDQTEEFKIVVDEVAARLSEMLKF
jgi:hypothetical protein